MRRLHLALAALALLLAVPAAQAQVAVSSRPKLDCEAPVPVELMNRAPFQDLAFANFWTARRNLVLWEKREDVRQMLDELESAAKRSGIYFRTRGVYDMVSKTPSLLQDRDRNMQQFYTSQLDMYRQAQGAPEAYLTAVSRLLANGGTQAMRDLWEAWKALGVAQPDFTLAIPPGADPLATASAFEWLVSDLTSLSCVPRPRTLSQATAAPNPKTAYLPVTEFPDLHRMYHQKANSLFDNMVVMAGVEPIPFGTLGWSRAYPSLEAAVRQAKPLVVAQIGTLSQDSLTAFDKRVHAFGITGETAYSMLGRDTEVNQAIVRRRTALVGLASIDAPQLSNSEKAKRNTPPTKDELLALVSNVAYEDTRRNYPLELVRTGPATFEAYKTSALLGRMQISSATISISSVRCQPKGNRQQCSYFQTITFQRYILGHPANTYGTGLEEFSAVFYWGANGLTSDDPRNVAIGWHIPGYSAGAAPVDGSSTQANNDRRSRERDNDAIYERSRDETAERERRAEADRQRYQDDQEERRRQNPRRCGPAPNIC